MHQALFRGFAFKLYSASGIFQLIFLLLCFFSCEKEDPDDVVNLVEQVAPNAVSDLMATPTSCNQINLSWTDNSDNEEGFVIRQSITGVAGEFSPVATLEPDVTIYQVTGLLPSTTYYFRVSAFNEIGYKVSGKVSATTLSNEYSPPSITAPANSTGYLTVSISYDWGQLVSSNDYYELEESTVSSTSGFTRIHKSDDGIHASPYEIQLKRSSGTYYYKARIHRGSPYPGYSSFSDVVQVVVTESPTRLKLINNTSYPIISFSVDNVEEFQNSSEGILPGHSYLKDITKGVHHVRVANGFYDGSSKWEMYTGTFDYSQPSGTYTHTINDPTINQILTGFKNSGIWKGNYFDSNLNNHNVYFVFYADGTWKFYLDNTKKSNGQYALIGRYPSNFSLVFKVGSNPGTDNGTLFEVFRKFYMDNGPDNWKTIEYIYQY